MRIISGLLMSHLRAATESCCVIPTLSSLTSECDQNKQTININTTGHYFKLGSVNNSRSRDFEIQFRCE